MAENRSKNWHCRFSRFSVPYGHFCYKSMVIWKPNYFLRLPLKQYMDPITGLTDFFTLPLLWGLVSLWFTAQVNAVLRFIAPMWLELTVVLDTRAILTIINFTVGWKMTYTSLSRLSITASVHFAPFLHFTLDTKKVWGFIFFILLCVLKGNSRLAALDV